MCPASCRTALLLSLASVGHTAFEAPDLLLIERSPSCGLLSTVFDRPVRLSLTAASRCSHVSKGTFGEFIASAGRSEHDVGRHHTPRRPETGTGEHWEGGQNLSGGLAEREGECLHTGIQ